MTDEEKIILCSGKSASLGLDSLLTVPWGGRSESIRRKYERAQRLLQEANEEFEELVT